MKKFNLKGITPDGKPVIINGEGKREIDFRMDVYDQRGKLRVIHCGELKSDFWCTILGHTVSDAQMALYEAQTIASKYEERTIVCNRCLRILE